MNKFINQRNTYQFVKFGIIGLTGAIIDFGILNILAVILKYNVYLSASISFTFAASNNFYWNKKWTFKGQATDKKIKIQYIEYLTVAVIGFFINLLILRIFIPYFVNVFNLDSSRALVINSAKIIATLLVFLWNFSGSKLLVFREAKK